jgi:hypothetical protein
MIDPAKKAFNNVVRWGLKLPGPHQSSFFALSTIVGMLNMRKKKRRSLDSCCSGTKSVFLRVDKRRPWHRRCFWRWLGWNHGAGTGRDSIESHLHFPFVCSPDHGSIPFIVGHQAP